ncbi:NAD(P)/FAD-dependent oxidoreductase [Rhizobium puerariae]|uniref:Thioredoxin reductase n=1 Tax=Rhizobium puerariae TaxID=1585791 RepID=A0ABV6ALG6_9HYPH
MTYDAIIVGGSYAGLSAALPLARARRKILVIDEGIRRNRFAKASYGFLGQDGRPPEAIARDAREQLLRYPTVEWLEGRAEQAKREEKHFAIRTGDGRRLSARRLVLAIGIADDLPGIPGLAERWGRSVFHCPYCHGYELDQGHIGVIAVSEASMHHALMLPDWGRTTFLLNGAFTPDSGQEAELHERGVTIEAASIARIGGDADVVLTDGRTIRFDGLFTLPKSRPASPIASQLGCEFDETGLYPFIRTGMTKETSVPGVFACGDAARAAGSVPLAVGDGNMAGAATHQSLLFRRD